MAAEFPDKDLLRLGRGVCLIQTVDGEDRGFKATGFHYGGGWVMSNAHNFRDKYDDKTEHSKASSASFTFIMDGEVKDANGVKVIEPTAKNTIVFVPQERTMFIHHRKPGRGEDRTNMDIAMIKLGKQYEYARNKFKSWEIEEEKLLVELDSHLTACAEIQPPEPIKNAEVYGIHYGNITPDKKDDNIKFVRSNIADMDEDLVPKIHVERGFHLFPGGSSGCPVYMKDTQGKYRLVGLNFSKKKESVSYALRWTKGIQEFIGHKVGLSIILGIGTYFAYKTAEQLGTGKLPGTPSDEKKELKEIATTNHLTIYLFNGDIIKEGQE